jgi:hypothetical protein
MADDQNTKDDQPHLDGEVERTIPAAPKPWRQLAEAVLCETDHDKILQLAQELCDAVDEQVLGHRKKTGDG